MVPEPREPNTSDAGSSSRSAESSPGGGPFSQDWRNAGLLLFLALAGLIILPGRWILLHPVLMGGAMFRLWWRRGRDPVSRSVAPQYEPPDGLSPAEVGILIDHTLDMRDITATLADLAHRGYLDIEEAQADSPSESVETSKEYLFVRTSEPGGWEELPAHERDLLYALFAEDTLDMEHLPEEIDAVKVLRRLFGGESDGDGEELEADGMSHEEMFKHLLTGRLEGGQIVRKLYRQGRKRVRMSDLEDSFYIFTGILHAGFLDRLEERGYYHGRPGGRRGIYLLAGMGAMTVMWFFGEDPATVLASVLTAMVVGGVGWFMPARTPKGARAVSEARGFEEFLDRVEEHRFRRMIDSPRGLRGAPSLRGRPGSGREVGRGVLPALFPAEERAHRQRSPAGLVEPPGGFP